MSYFFMPEYSEFVTLLADAYEHLYDLVYLRSHTFMDMFTTMAAASRKETAWELHHLLLNVIKELDPGPQAPAFSREWRRHRLMVLRYVDGLTPQAVADQLAISRRHYYRAHDAALDAVASILWNRFITVKPEASVESTPVAEPVATDRMELLRLEAAQMAQTDRHAQIDEVISGVLALLRDKIDQRQLAVISDFEPEIPDVQVDRRLLRQLFLGVLGYLVDSASDGNLAISTEMVESEQHVVQVAFRIESPDAIVSGAIDNMQERLSALEELAMLAGTSLVPVRHQSTIIGFSVELPISKPQPVILVIDDNEDIGELFKRYLEAHLYQVVLASNGQQALQSIQKIQPFAVILDLMMPDMDGWDLLQVFLNQPDTLAIPVIICSILRQKELALSLGATAFLEKPVSEEALISLLALLDKRVT
jgi:CheY-like chemotaxis protein